ncbi:MAG: hypothetical protein ACOYLQ_08490 [Hyphomicrobiaceae bacterium]
MLWIVKLTVTPLLVGLVSLAARRWGPTMGGLLMAMPWMTGPILFFLALERGPVFAREMCVGVELGAAGIGAWALAYAGLARRARWPVCLAAAIAGYVASGLLLGSVPFALTGAALLAYAALIGTFIIVPRPPEPDVVRGLPWWDIPVRMAATALLVAIIVTTSGILGPQYSGIAATYPVIATVVTTFTHHRWGAPATIRLLRAMVLSLQAFTTFFLVVGSTIESLGTVPAFALALATALTIAGLVITLVRSGVVKS